MLGLTLECSRCHDHKYDPISQAEYYGMTSFFNNIDEHGLYSHFTETAPTPTMLLYAGTQEEEHRRLLDQIQQLHAKIQDRQKSLQDTIGSELPSADVPSPDWTLDFKDLKSSGDYVAIANRVDAKQAASANAKNNDAASSQGTGAPSKGEPKAESPGEEHAIEFGGDDAYPCKDAPKLTRAKPFSLSLWVRPKQHSPRMLVVHQSRAAEDSAFRGFSLVLDNGHPVVSLIHFWPGNAIQIRGVQALPVNSWSQIAITYDGFSKANGLRLYVDGRAIETVVVRDRLTRDFVHRADWGDSDVNNANLALGARFRDVGFKDGAIDDVMIFKNDLTAYEVRRLFDSQCDASPNPLSATELGELAKQHRIQRDDQPIQSWRIELGQLMHDENELNAKVRQIMVMEELESIRPTYLLARGAYDARSREVPRSVPVSIFAWPEDLAKTRLGFAQWVIDRQNPLTSRVAVNRIWRLFFGRGIVATSEDFGNQGETPSHPELLDYLAADFMAHGWDVKRLCKSIVLSSTYRQSSTPVMLLTTNATL